MVRFLLIFVILVLGIGCGIPRDPEGTLESVSGKTLRVGLTEAPPWVVRQDTTPSGIEPWLIQGYASSIGARVDWTWAGLEDNVEMLKKGNLDLIAGGMTLKNPLTKKLGVTRSYFKSAHGSKHVLATIPGENRMLVSLEAYLKSREDTIRTLAAREGQ